MYAILHLLFLDASIQEQLGETGACKLVDLFTVFVDLIRHKEGFKAGGLGEGFEGLGDLFVISS